MINKKIATYSSIFALLVTGRVGDGCLVFAQNDIVPTASQLMLKAPSTATPVAFSTDADISQYSIPEEPIQWGMDVAWDSEDNVRRGTNFIGKDCLKIGRVSFQPSDLVDKNGQLSAAQQRALQRRLDHIALSGIKDIVLNCDHEVLMNKENFPNADQNYANYNGKPMEWYRVIKASVQYCQSKGFNVVTISPFNEPDYTAWKEGTKSEFKEIAKLISEDPDLAGIRISAGNTLNCDQAASWYNAVKPYVTEGNTHQLAGSFDNYAAFWQLVRKDGNHATADELHNVGEAFIGAHYGMQSGIWWGWDAAARGDYCRASYYGKEIGYGENRKAWSAATVYKRQDGRIDGFLGTSERQATPSSYEFVSIDRPAYFDGYGPYYQYVVDMPGGTGYQKGQTNAERMVQIHSGEDIPARPVSAGSYVLMNAYSNNCLSTMNSATQSGVAAALGSYVISIVTKQVPSTCKWKVDPLAATSGGDFGYFLLQWEGASNSYLDILNWNTSAGADLIVCQGGKGANEQWMAEYAGDNFWYIRSRHSGLYMEIRGDKKSSNTAVQMAAFTGEAKQRWRFIPVENNNPKLEREAPAVPSGLKINCYGSTAVAHWCHNTDKDLAGYQLMRDGNVIARLGIDDTLFVDNDICPGVEYQYSVRSIDATLNVSAWSTPVSAKLDKQPQLLLHYPFDKDSLDYSGNGLNFVPSRKMTYATNTLKEGAGSVYFSASKGDCLQLPANVGYYDEMTIVTWVRTMGTTTWMRIFDFGNDPEHYMFLTPNNGTQARLVLRNGGDEQILSTTKMSSNVWHHVAVTFCSDSVSLYIDGKCTTSKEITIRPSEIQPRRNYIGKSQYMSDPTFEGYMDDFRIYNCALSSEQIELLRAGKEIDLVSLPAIQEVEPKEDYAIYSLDGRMVRSDAKGILIKGSHKFIIVR